MKQDKHETKIIFRKFPQERKTDRLDIIAFFPEIKENKGNIMSYMHIGQHGVANPEHILSLGKPTYSEYEPLLQELISIGYKPYVMSDKEVKDWLKENIDFENLDLPF